MNVAFRAECASNYQSCGWRPGFLVGLPMRYTLVRVGVSKSDGFHKGSTLSLSQQKDSLCCRKSANRIHLSTSVSTARSARPIVRFVIKKKKEKKTVLAFLIQFDFVPVLLLTADIVAKQLLQTCKFQMNHFLMYKFIPNKELPTAT